MQDTKKSNGGQPVGQTNANANLLLGLALSTKREVGFGSSVFRPSSLSFTWTLVLGARMQLNHNVRKEEHIFQKYGSSICSYFTQLFRHITMMLLGLSRSLVLCNCCVFTRRPLAHLQLHRFNYDMHQENAQRRGEGGHKIQAMHLEKRETQLIQIFKKMGWRRFIS